MFRHTEHSSSCNAEFREFRMLRNVLLVLAALGGLGLFVFVSGARGEDPPLNDARQTPRGLFSVDVDAQNGVHVRAGLVDIQIGGSQPAGARPADADGAAGQRWLFRGTQLINTPVMDTGHHEIGRIDDAVLNLRSGRLRYLAVEYAAKSGRDRLFAVPLTRFQLARQKDAGFYLVVNFDANMLERAPGFPRDDWPDFGNRRWQDEIDIFYGVDFKPDDVTAQIGASRVAVRRTAHFERVSHLAGFPVISDKSEQRIGSLADVIVDLETGHARYGVLQLDNSLAAADRRFAVPWGNLDYDIEDGRACLELEVKARRMTHAPSFENAHWPDLLDPTFATGIDEFYASGDD
ncbi:hypothetical protein GC176_07625 [bacterium]|nr:hypothetical protein [bacterium]